MHNHFLLTAFFVGFEGDYTVSEDVGSFEACFGVLKTPESEKFNLSLDLVVISIDGSAIGIYCVYHCRIRASLTIAYILGGADFVAIRAADLDVYETLSSDRHRACFNVTINFDKTLEGNESFSLFLLFDEFVSYEVRTQVNIQPSVVHVNILDVTRELIF